ncbi:DNA repair protein RadA [Curtobacterium sp. Leaf261]|uniref:DNA repair protein RadA n=1 Tax=Curtobacterium sp. Leaf261 TaxID=1736311 RepID=UPI0006FDDB9F|nr:DNA repair protein RadA [Curtobacterium sp. Leaf261]KQO63759.1 DNA repair protein RadA [Curtobacterium sp. Leaf261]
MARPQSTFRCTECGWTSLKWVGRCGECQSWGTVEDATAAQVSTRGTAAVAVTGSRAAKPITQVVGERVSHWQTGIGEFDRVLGGGIVPGAAILLSGEPGVGKSTLLLEVASQAASRGKRVLYVSAEESVDQVRLRAERTGAMHDELFLASEVDLSVILGQIDQVKPDLVIADSVQTISSSSVDGIAGGVSQVREVASTLIRVAKDRALPILIVGHVTKDGTIAGPRLLEHLVDVVCHFEGDRQTALRFVRALKNRFGPTDEVGCFDMAGDGIHEVPDPSGLFMSRSGTPVSGTCITIAMEGRRALPVEVQALVVPSSAPQPRRVVNGVDSSRVAMLLAVLERRAGIKLSDSDVYVSTVGGMRLVEPGADLAIALALASAARDRPYPQTLAAIGEISLAGEIRPATGAKQRANEGGRLGFTTILGADAEHLREALRVAFGASRSVRERELDAAF